MPGRRKRGGPQSRFVDVVKDNTQRLGVTEDGRDGVR